MKMIVISHRCGRRNQARTALLSGAALAAIVVATPAGAQNIDTMSQWNGTTSIASWGVPNTQTYGQTITPIAGQNILSNFTFQLSQGGGVAAQYQANVYQWDGTNNRIVGPALYTSGLLTAPSGATFTPVTILTGGVHLNAGTQYVLFLTTSNGAQVASSYRYGALTNNTAVPNGQFVFNNNGNNFASLSTTTWSNIAEDLAMSANFVPQSSGEAVIGARQGAFQLMNDFMGVMLDPFVDGRNTNGGGPALGFAPEARAQQLPQAAQAYASVVKAPIMKAPGYDPRWTLWGAAYGGYNRTQGNAGLGTHDLASRAGGFAAGADYRIAPNSVVGFALAGGGTGWNVSDGLASGGDSTAFQAGVYGTTHWGPAYVAGTFAFSQHWMTTNRTDFASDRLKGDFAAQSYGGRLEGGYRLATGLGGITPYAAVQSVSFHTPSFTEADLSGGNNGLTFSGRTATDTRSELGARYDHMIGNGLTFRGRLAWAHDWVSDPTISATAAVLAGSLVVPGAFLLNGGAPPANSALVTAGVERRLANGMVILAKFDGNFGSGFNTYAGTAQVKFPW